jgi:hypothetical protein
MNAPVVGRERNRASGVRNGLAIGLFVFSVSLPSFCGGQFASWNGFEYLVNGTDITIMGYTGPSGNVAIPSSTPGVNGSVTSTLESWGLELTAVPEPSTWVAVFLALGLAIPPLVRRRLRRSASHR